MNWLTPDRTNNIPPFRLLNSKHIAHLGKAQLSQFRMMKSLMGVIESEAKSRNLSFETVKTSSAATRFWEEIGPELFEKYGLDTKGRKNQILWKSCYNHIVKMNKNASKRNHA